MKRAIFLDRDGVIINNQDHYYIWKKEQMKLVDGITENLHEFQKKGFQIFIVSNQGGVSRGLYSKEDVLKLHNVLLQIFKNNQIEIAEIAFCPHHPEVENCFCRKPDSLMIDRLIARHNLSKENSYFIGDSDSDMEAARKAGVQGIKIDSNKNMFPSISFLIQ